MVAERKYVHIQMDGTSPANVVYTLEKGMNRGDPGQLSERASPSLKEAHHWLSGGYASLKEGRVTKTNEHMLRLLNDIEKSVCDIFGKSPFEKLATAEDIGKKQEQMNEDLYNDAGILLAKLWEAHKKVPDLEPSLAAYLMLRPHVVKRMKGIISDYAKDRRNWLRKK